MDSKEIMNSGNVPSKPRVNKANRKTVAARYNVKVLRSLETALLNNPEIDLTTLLSSAYSQKLASFKRPGTTTNGPAKRSFADHDIRSRLNEDEAARTIFPLSPEVDHLLGRTVNHTAAIIELLEASEVLYESAWAASVMVFRVNDNIVVKAGHAEHAINEHKALTFLQKHVPNLPVPKPHGLIRIGAHSFLFTSFIPGINLEKAWPQLDHGQKESISDQLDGFLTNLRLLPFKDTAPLGGVGGTGCKDSRRSQRSSGKPIMNLTDFQNFIFAGSDTATPLYIDFLRNMMPESKACVFTHGDIRPANIMVQVENGSWKIEGIIDWEFSGFYPDYWEAVKTTNLLTPRNHFDWYNYIPQSVSPTRYHVQWLVDRVWERSLVNS